VNEYIRDNPAKVIWITPDVPETFAEAIAAEGYNRTDYINRMSINTTWGGMIEICAVAELYEVNISIFKRNDDPERRYAWIGTFKYSLNHALTITLYILYTGNSHYDSLIDVVHAHTGGENICQRLTEISDIQRAKNFCLKDRQFEKGKDVLVTEASGRKRLACSSIRDSNSESPELKRMRTLCNEKRMEARISRTDSPEMKKQRLVENDKSREARLKKVETTETEQRRENNAARRNAYKKKLNKNEGDYYAKEYDEKSRFIVCAVCGTEGSQTGSILLADNENLVINCGIREEYEAYVKTSDERTTYEKIFKEEMTRHFDHGLINGLKSICVVCSSEMKIKKRATNEISHIPKLTNFKGLFTGSIPTELS
jgi:hypothetical protein